MIHITADVFQSFVFDHLLGRFTDFLENLHEQLRREHGTSSDELSQLFGKLLYVLVFREVCP